MSKMKEPVFRVTVKEIGDGVVFFTSMLRDENGELTIPEEGMLMVGDTLEVSVHSIPVSWRLSKVQEK